tara:strand:+ start:11485 stop:11904 length:420 start_codon:yes stop_codon:yes gene_type:complete
MTCGTSLSTFFKALPMSDPAETMAFYKLLAERLPQRGRPRWRSPDEPCKARVRQQLLSEDAEAAISKLVTFTPGEQDDTTLLGESEKSALLNRKATRERRELESAVLIQKAVLPHLYIPGGAMHRLGMRELVCVDDESE